MNSVMSSERRKRIRKNIKNLSRTETSFEDEVKDVEKCSSGVCEIPAEVPKTKPRNHNLVNAFSAIVDFVNDLWSLNDSNQKSPLALYHRLLQHIKFTDVDAIEKAVGGFRNFFAIHMNSIIKDIDSIPRDTRIDYGTSKIAYIEIQKYIHLSRNDETVKNCIRKHLLTISAIITPDQKTISELEKKLETLSIDSDTTEGKFVTNMMAKAKSTMEKMDTSNPAAAITGLFQSGILTDMISGLQQGVGTGQMDPRKLFGTMQTAMNSLLPPESGVDLASTMETAMKAASTFEEDASSTSKNCTVEIVKKE